MIRIVLDSSPMDFQKVVENLEANHKYFYRAFATNAVGTSYGSVESFKTLREERGPDWIDAQPGADQNWWTSEWFGNFYAPDHRGWIMHEELGWVFVYGQPDRAVWLWHTSLGWVWTHSEVFPFLYSNQSGGWMFFYGNAHNKLVLYDYLANRWLIVAK